MASNPAPAKPRPCVQALKPPAHVGTGPAPPGPRRLCAAGRAALSANPAPAKPSCERIGTPAQMPVASSTPANPRSPFSLAGRVFYLNATSPGPRSLAALPYLLPLAFGIGLLVVWQAACQFGAMPAYLLPSPAGIGLALWQQKPLLLVHLAASLGTALAGLGIAICLGLALAWLMELSRWLRQLCYPYLVVSQSVPLVFVFPLLLIWFGFGPWPRVAIVALICLFPLVVSLSDAMRRTPQDCQLALASIGASRIQLLRFVRFPMALPALFSGMRIAATYSMMAAVIAEWLGAPKGLGVYMLFAYKSFLPERVFAAIVLVVVLSLLLVAMVRLAERLCIPWQRSNL